MKIQVRKGFTLIELLVVILILGVLVSIALPSYMGAVKASRTKTADSNARTIASAIKSAEAKLGSSDLSTVADLTNATTVAELGAIPQNPCTGTATTSDYTITAGGSGTYTIQAVTSANCSATSVFTIYP